MSISLEVRCSTGARFTLQVDPQMTVAEFKQVLVEQSQVPAELQRLVYKGVVLRDEATLESYNLNDQHVVHLVRGATTSSASAVPSRTAPAAATPDPFGFGGMGGGFSSMQQQMMQNPTMMRELMNSPAMQSMLNNPELIRSMIMSNPQMRQLIERNPDLGHVLNDSQLLRHSMDAARNPELMREMMRNTDRAMSNIESHPEGFNMLRRLYQNVQEPLWNATTGRDLSAQDSSSSPSSSSSLSLPAQSPTPNAAPLPNPWNPSANTVRPPASVPSVPAAATRGPTPTSTPSATSTSTSTSTSAPAPAIVPGTVPTAVAGGGGMNPFASFGGGLPGIDPSAVGPMLQDPTFRNMMQQMLSNPQFVNQMTSSNPLLGDALNSNPQLLSMLQNPQFLQQLGDPNALQSMMQMQQSLSGLQGNPMMSSMFGAPSSALRPPAPPSTATAGSVPGSVPGPVPGSVPAPFNPFSMFGRGLFGAPTPVSTVPATAAPSSARASTSAPAAESAEVRYRTQLQRLSDMGFTDVTANIKALNEASGNVNMAIDRLLTNEP
eukprot:GILK01003660.1.p1 GENE.GILK01003660.1~~GILK01003660.1.p1  ORF type:complete len:549 (-),score=79.44 GILK01003660.1:212-1858(-)